MKLVISVFAALLFAFPAWPAASPPQTWQQAVERLAAVRQDAEHCTAIIKARGTEAARAAAYETYGIAKMDVDAVIAGLVTAVAQGDGPDSLPGLRPRLERATARIGTLCHTAQALLPAEPGGKGGAMLDIGGILQPLLDALVALVIDGRDRDAQTRRTIQTQVEGLAWRAFADIPPARW